MVSVLRPGAGWAVDPPPRAAHGDAVFHDSNRYVAACELLDLVHREDPRPGPAAELSWAMHYHQRLVAQLMALAPDAPEHACLAARGRLMRGWYRRRRDFPTGPHGHRQWRDDAARFHSGEAIGVLIGVGYRRDELLPVVALIEGRADPADPGAGAFYDAVGLTFFRLQLPAFARRHGLDDTADAAGDHWRRMSAPARETVLAASSAWPEELRAVLDSARAAS